MFLIKATYEDKKQTNSIAVSRTVDDNADLNMVLGEIIYSVETQAKNFVTHDIFTKIELPDVITITKVLMDESNEDFSLKISITKKKSK